VIISVDLNDSPLLKEGIDRARAEAVGNVIAKQLRQKFADAVPPDIKQRLAGLSIDDLEAMSERVIEADSIEDILTVPATSTAPQKI
jgi:hypothetical protein